MFDAWITRRTAAKDVEANIPRDVAVERFITARHGARPKAAPDSPAALRARAAASNRAQIGELETDAQLRESALPAGHAAMPYVIAGLYVAEAYGCFDVLATFDLPPEAQAIGALALAAFVMWVTHAAASSVSGRAAVKPTLKQRLVSSLGLLAFVVSVLGLATQRLGSAVGDSAASLSEVAVMLGVCLGPALLLLTLWPRFVEGRALALARDQARSKLAAETAALRNAEQFLDYEHDGGTSWDRATAVSSARFLAEYDREAARRSK